MVDFCSIINQSNIYIFTIEHNPVKVKHILQAINYNNIQVKNGQKKKRDIYLILCYLLVSYSFLNSTNVAQTYAFIVG